MSDDLIRRLRDAYPATQDFEHTLQGDLMDEAADRIEELEAERDGIRDDTLVEAYNALFVVPAASQEREAAIQMCQAAISALRKEGEG